MALFIVHETSSHAMLSELYTRTNAVKAIYATGGPLGHCARQSIWDKTLGDTVFIYYTTSIRRNVIMLSSLIERDGCVP